MKRLFKLLVILALVYTSYASCATIQGNLNVKSKLEVSKTGKFIDGVQSDTWISIIKSNAKIRYNNGINKWQFTNDGITWLDFGSAIGQESDPIFSAWDKSTGIAITHNQITDWNTSVEDFLTSETDPIWISEKTNYYTKTEIDNKGYLTNESDPVFTSWNKSDGISITHTQISDWVSATSSFLTSESDPIWISDKSSYYTKTEIDNKGYLTSETDPIFSSWNKTDGISISYTQVTDFNTGINNNSTIQTLVSKSHDFATVNSPLSISGQEISLNYDTNTLDISDNKLKVKDNVFSSFGHTHYLNDLIDVDTTGIADGKVLKYSSTESKWIPQDDLQSSGGASTFLDLTDTPSSYSGQAGKYIKVNSGETGLEFTTISGGSGTPGGNNKTIQYNNNGSFAGDDNLTWDSGLKQLTISGETKSETVTVTGSVLALPVLSSKPSPPPSGKVYIYYRNGSMYYQDSTGTETKMCETVISGDAYYETDIVFNFNGTNEQRYCNSNTNYGRLRRGNTLAMSSASLSTSDKKYGSASLYVGQVQNGPAGFAIDNPNGFDLLDDEWCWEAWIKISSANLSCNVLLSSGSGGDYFMMGRNSYSICYMPMEDTYQLFFNATVDGTTVADYYADFSSDISGSWHHLAVERDKNHSPELRVFLDGEEQSVTTNTAFTSTPIKTVGFLSIGCGNTVPEGFNGYIDDLRFRRSCPYQSDFTPPGEW